MWRNNFPHNVNPYLFCLEAVRDFEKVIELESNFFNDQINNKIIYILLQTHQEPQPMVIRKWPLLPFYTTWQNLLQAHTSPSARDLAFRISHEILPTKLKLNYFGILKNTLCEICEQTEENTEYFFITCPVGKLARNFARALTDTNSALCSKGISLDFAVNDSDPQLSHYAFHCSTAVRKIRNLQRFEHQKSD
jgi:hypothetical protein